VEKHAISKFIQQLKGIEIQLQGTTTLLIICQMVTSGDKKLA
jgi:hypothetical protein